MANVMLSEKEFLLLQNADFILTKNSIIAKIQTSLGRLSTAYQQINLQLPAELKIESPKIAKGENYKSLPWLMLDFPRYFTKQDVFAIRSFCWWGNYCNISLHLKGKYLQLFGLNVFHALDHEWKVNVTNEWEHDMDADCYMDKDVLEYNTSMQVLRIAKKIPLQQLAIVEENFIEAFTEIRSALISQAVK